VNLTYEIKDQKNGNMTHEGCKRLRWASLFVTQQFHKCAWPSMLESPANLLCFHEVELFPIFRDGLDWGAASQGVLGNLLSHVAVEVCANPSIVLFDSRKIHRRDWIKLSKPLSISTKSDSTACSCLYCLFCLPFLLAQVILLLIEAKWGEQSTHGYSVYTCISRHVLQRQVCSNRDSSCTWFRIVRYCETSPNQKQWHARSQILSRVAFWIAATTWFPRLSQFLLMGMIHVQKEVRSISLVSFAIS
jgi:hypothetical protein